MGSIILTNEFCSKLLNILSINCLWSLYSSVVTFSRPYRLLISPWSTGTGAKIIVCILNLLVILSTVRITAFFNTFELSLASLLFVSLSDRKWVAFWRRPFFIHPFSNKVQRETKNTNSIFSLFSSKNFSTFLEYSPVQFEALSTPRGDYVDKRAEQLSGMVESKSTLEPAPAVVAVELVRK